MILNRPLKPSRTHKTRTYSVTWIGHPLADWVLVIRQGERHRVNYSEELYWVQWDGEPVYGVRSYLLAVDRDESHDVYNVLLAGSSVSCTCKGFQCQKTCKHCDVISEANREGEL